MEQELQPVEQTMVNPVKTNRKFFSSIGFRMFFATMLMTLVQSVALVVLYIVKPGAQNDSFLTMLVSMLSMYAVGFPLAFLIMKKPQKTSIEKHEMNAKELAKAAMAGYAVTTIGNLIGTGITTAIGMLKGSPVTNPLVSFLDGGNVWLVFLFAGICAPIFEELLFRKMLCDRLVRYGEGTAILLSGLLFGLFHGNLSQFVYAMPLGMLFAFIYVKTGNIKNTILLHMIVNLLGGVLPTALFGTGEMQFSVAMVIWYVLMLVIDIAGVSFLVRGREKIEICPGEIAIEKGRRFSTVICNFGMLLFVIVWTIITLSVTLAM